MISSGAGTRVPRRIVVSIREVICCQFDVVDLLSIAVGLIVSAPGIRTGMTTAVGLIVYRNTNLCYTTRPTIRTHGSTRCGSDVSIEQRSIVDLPTTNVGFHRYSKMPNSTRIGLSKPINPPSGKFAVAQRLIYVINYTTTQL